MAKMTLSSTAAQPKASTAALWAAMLCIYLVWGSTYLAIRYAVETLPPFFMAATRFLLAGSILFVLRRASGDPIPARSEWRGSAALGLFLLLGGTGTVTWAEQVMPSGLTALMVSSSPLWMLLFEAVLPGGRRFTWRAIAGIIIGFAGIVLLFWPGQGSLLNIYPIGAIALVFATMSWAFGSVISRSLRLPASPLMGTAAEMLCGGAGLVIISLLTGEFGRLHLAAVSVTSLLALAYLIMVGSLVAFTAYTWLLRVAPTSLVSTYAYVNPVVALFLGLVIGNESLSQRSLVAAAIILGAVILTTYGSSKK